MALKFLNKKGWHTGSLRNIENVWKAEQKHDAEQKKLEELRKQIHEERERHEFRLLQEQAGLVPRQERLDFLYESGLAVGKSSNSDGFKALEALPGTSTASASAPAPASSSKEAAAPGALFEDKPHSSNDAWRKLHSDPLLMIRQREQEALARIRNNPVQMSMIQKSVKQNKEAKAHEKKEGRRKHHHRKRNHRKDSSSEEDSDSNDLDGYEKKRRKADRHKSLRHADKSYFDDRPKKIGSSKEENRHKNFKSPEGMNGRGYEKGSPRSESHSSVKRTNNKSDQEGHHYEDRKKQDMKIQRQSEDTHETRSYKPSPSNLSSEALCKRRNVSAKLSEEERAARLREMQLDAEVHEEQRWKRIKQADEDDARELTRSNVPSNQNFMDAAQKTVYGAGKVGSSTIEESIRRRVYYSQGKSGSSDVNAFRR